jgi:hypothetical protein
MDDFDLIDVTSGSEPDPAWSFTDAAGHTHTWATRGETWEVYEDSPATDEYPAVSWPRCKVCHKRIQPQERAMLYREYIQVRRP